MCNKSDGIAVGSGDRYGLYLRSNLISGYSTICTTFSNEILSMKEKFDI